MAADEVDLPPYVRMLWRGDDGGRPGPKRSIDLRAIGAAGVRLADAGGVGEISMRAVAAEVGVTPMALYRYVRSKDELLEMVVDEALGPVALPPAGRGWRSRTTAWAHGARARLELHPWTLSVPITKPPLLPHNIAWTEAGLEALSGTGLGETQKLSALLVVDVYVRGQTQLGLGLADAERAESGLYSRRLLALADPRRYPRVAAAMRENAAQPEGDFQREEFDFGLRTVLDGIAARAARR